MLTTSNSADPTSLDNLRDIVVPEPVSWWPPAPGWFLLALVVVIALLWGIGLWMARRYRNRYRRAALEELLILEGALTDPLRRPVAAKQLPVLLKWTALAAFPRQQVASLAGSEWIAFLNRSAGLPPFEGRTGSLLMQLSYSDTACESMEMEDLKSVISAARLWVAGHRSVQRSNPTDVT